MKKGLILLFVLFYLNGLSAVEAVDILQQASILGKAPLFSMTIQMDIITKKGNKSRGIEIFSKEDKAGKKTLLQITSPSFLRDMKFLAHDNSDNTASRWLKTSQGTRRISTGDSSERLFDSDFTVEDFSSFKVNELENRMLEEKTINNVECYTVESVFKQPKGGSLKKIIYAAKESKIIMQVDFYNTDNIMVRQYQLLEMQKSGNLQFPGTCKMSSLLENSSTLITIKSIDTVKDIPEKYFNMANL